MRTLRLAKLLLRTAGIKEKIPLLANKYKLTPGLVSALAFYDPTINGEYIEWIVRRAKQGNIIYHEISEYNPIYRIEDGSRVAEALKVFHKIKNKKKLLEKMGLKPDINLYTLQDLEDIADKFREEPFEEGVHKGGQEIYNDGKVQIIKIGVEHDDEEGFGVEDFQSWVDAACAYAEGTHWCTKGRENAEYYLNEGPLYVIRLNNKRVAQFHPQSEQFMDVKDRPFDHREYPDVELALWKSSIPKIGSSLVFDIINNLGENIELGSPQREEEILNYGQGYTYALIRYIEYAKGPWLEAEPSILLDPYYALVYACDVIKKRWPIMEDKAIKFFGSSRNSVLHDLNIVDYMSKYSIRYMKQRWPEFEEIMNSKIRRDAKYFTPSYREYLRVLVP